MKGYNQNWHDTRRSKQGLLWALPLMVLAAPALAEWTPGAPPLADEVLASQRGGFLVGNLEIAIGLEQLVSVNGETVVVSRLHIPNLNQGADKAAIASQLETALAVPDLGDGTVIDTRLVNDSGVLTKIQNSMNETVIQTLRRYNIELNNFDPNARMPGQLDSQYLQTLHPR
ncbi:MAG: hypothetical protein R3175_14205 [Marinobacter sp.]|uniref:hypothetical protein n=1 Tax=Marinobacter sp. TaxID=50741 RepID=UPI00299CEA0C|nr:hypothetical protein [Marinobacter sp.]MDX1757205.1 hypothetical protein [Marinobacter sp.]